MRLTARNKLGDRKYLGQLNLSTESEYTDLYDHVASNNGRVRISGSRARGRPNNGARL